MNIPCWAIERTHTVTPYMAGRRSGGGAHLLVRIAGYGFTMVIADTPEHAVMAHDAGGVGVLMWRECVGDIDDGAICAEVTMLVDEFERTLDTIKFTPPSLADIIRNLPYKRMHPIPHDFPIRHRGNAVNGQSVRTYDDPLQGHSFNFTQIDCEED